METKVFLFEVSEPSSFVSFTAYLCRYFVLRSDGTLKYYEDMTQETLKAVLDLRFYALDEVAEGGNVDDVEENATQMDYGMTLRVILRSRCIVDW